MGFNSEYYFEDGLRKVTPYYMVVDTVVDAKLMRRRKSFWQGNSSGVTLQDFLENMFPFTNKRYQRYLADAGQLFLNFEAVDRD